MFDPLEMYSAKKEQYQSYEFPLTELQLSNREVIEDERTQDSSVQVLDLPDPRTTDPTVVLCILILLRPARQVNFIAQTNITHQNIQMIQNENEYPSEWAALQQWYIKSPLKCSFENFVESLPLLSGDPLLLSYLTSVLKKSTVATDNIGVHEKIITESTMRISEGCGRAAAPSVLREFKVRTLEPAIKVYEPSLVGDNLGWKTWGSSLVLAEIVTDTIGNPSFKSHSYTLSRPLRVLELGAGTGLVGITWALKWETLHERELLHLVTTDLPEIVDNLNKNLELNHIASWVSAEVLDWTDPASFLAKNYGNSEQKFDVILIADPIYSPKHPDWIVEMIALFLAPSGTCHLVIPIRQRYKKERERLSFLLADYGLRIVEERSCIGSEDWGTVEYLYRKLMW